MRLILLCQFIFLAIYKKGSEVSNLLVSVYMHLWWDSFFNFSRRDPYYHPFIIFNLAYPKWNSVTIILKPKQLQFLKLNHEIDRISSKTMFGINSPWTLASKILHFFRHGVPTSFNFCYHWYAMAIFFWNEWKKIVSLHTCPILSSPPICTRTILVAFKYWRKLVEMVLDVYV